MRPLLLLFLLLVAGCATPQAPAPSTSAAADPGRPLTLWEVSRDGLPTSHLFGTCHLAVTPRELLPDDRRQLLLGAHRVVAEIDTASLNAAQMTQSATMGGGQTNSALLGQTTWTRLLERYGLPARIGPRLDTVHPMLVAVTLTGLLAQQRYGPTSESVDSWVVSQARGAGVEPDFLETPQDQLQMLTSFAPEDLREELTAMATPEGRERALAELNGVLDFCRGGDVPAAEALLSRTDRLGLNEPLLRRRNEAWLPQLEAWFAEGPTFVAVGAAHMITKHGLVPLLRARGYTVRQLRGQTASSASSGATSRRLTPNP